MNRDETTELLRLRWNLTNERFGEDTVTAWHDMFRNIDNDVARHALQAAAREGPRVSISDIFKHAPPRRPYDTDPDPPFVMTAEQNELNRRGQTMIAAQITWVAQRRRLRGGLTDAQWQRLKRERLRSAKQQLPDPAAGLTQPSINPHDYEPIETTTAATKAAALFERLP